MPTYRERMQQTRENMRDNKMVQWARDNRVPIGVGVGGLVFGYLVRGKTVHMAPAFNNTVAPVINPVFNNINAVTNGGHSRKIVRCLETDQMWPSMKAAAEATGNHITMMSKHCNGHLDELQGFHYVIDGLATG